MLVDVKLQKVSNYFIITKKHGVVCTILIKRFTSKIVSNYKANIESRQALNFS